MMGSTRDAKRKILYPYIVPIEDTRQRQGVMMESFKLGSMCLRKEMLDRGALSVCGLSVGISRAFILDHYANATMTSRVSRNTLISTYPSTALQPAATIMMIAALEATDATRNARNKARTMCSSREDVQSLGGRTEGMMPGRRKRQAETQRPTRWNTRR